MIIYCRDCLLEGIRLVDTPSHGTIHEGRAVCIRHFKRLLEGVLADRVQEPEWVDGELVRSI